MIKFCNRSSYIIGLFLVISIASFKFRLPDPDDPILKSILERIEAFDKENKQEKIFVQTDRPYYTNGDTIWLKGYIRKAESHAPSDLSNILHVALHADNQEEIQKLRLEITNGLAQGYLVVPRTASQGNYSLVAYTRWMRNYDARFSYIKQIPVFNFTENKINQRVGQKSAANFYFYPEGGFLVAGLESKVAFKATDSSGIGMAITGKIADNTGKVVAVFTCFNTGIGNFLFRPQAGYTYSATIRTPDSKILIVALPKALENGFVMRTESINESIIKVQVERSFNTEDAGDEKIFLIAKSGNKVVDAQFINFTKNSKSVTFSLVKNKLTEGVVQLTIFNQNGSPQCERLVYLHKRRQLAILVKTNQVSYLPRDKVQLNIEVKDKNGFGVPANLSVSVTDENALLKPQESILSSLYFGSYVTAKTDFITSYLTDDSPETRLTLDNLLITQGWRQFTWKELLEKDAIQKKRYTPEKDLVFKARAITADGHPLPATLVNILMSGTGNAYAAFTDADGRFKVILPDYEINGKALFRFFKNEQALSQIKVILDLDSTTSWLPLPEIESNASYMGYRQKAYNWYRIQETYNGLKIDNLQPEGLHQSALFKKGQAGTTSYKINTFEDFKNLAELFDEAIEPIALKKTKYGVESRIYSRQLKSYFTNSPLYIVDGKPTFDNQVVLSLPTEQIDRIELFNTANHLQNFSLMGRDGVIAIYTKSNNLNLPNLSDTVIPFEGIFTGREFNQLVIKSPASTALPVFKPMLYWQSDLKTDASGKAQITFNNADDVTKYRIIVEGISTNDLPGVGEVVYQVIKSAD